MANLTALQWVVELSLVVPKKTPIRHEADSGMESWDRGWAMGMCFSHSLSKGEACRMESEKTTDLASTAL